MTTVACELPAVQPATLSPHVQRMHLAEWMQRKPEGTFISTQTGEAWTRSLDDGFYYVTGSDVGYNVECVALEGPFMFITRA